MGAFTVNDAVALHPFTHGARQHCQTLGGGIFSLAACDVLRLLRQSFGIGEAAPVERFPTIGEGTPQPTKDRVPLDVICPFDY